MISLIRRILLVLALSQLLTITNLSQNRVFVDLDLPFYSTELPEDFMIAPYNKYRKLKYYEVKRIYKDDNVGSYPTELSKYYDTNGIPTNLNGMNTQSYSIAGNHFDPDFIVDSTFYEVNNKGQLDSLEEFYRSGKTRSFSFYYDANGFCIASKFYFKDSLWRTNHYEYDNKGRLIQKGNDTNFTYFYFNNERILEVYHQEGENRFPKFKYFYNENDRTRKTVRQSGRNDITEKIYYDEKWRPGIKIKYDFGVFTQNNRYIHNRYIHNYVYNVKSELVRISVSYVKGNILSDKWEYEMKYNSKGDCIEETMYDTWGRMLYKYRFIYEYYE